MEEEKTVWTHGMTSTYLKALKEKLSDDEIGITVMITLTILLASGQLDNFGIKEVTEIIYHDVLKIRSLHGLDCKCQGAINSDQA